MDSQLKQGLEMTRRMLELVKAGAWEEVAVLGAERLRLLHEWVNNAEPDMAQQNIGILQVIQALDKEIEILSLEGKEELADNLRQIHQGRKAGKAYRG
ncbi:MAG: flagellar protein FliT [Candidatus Thiodiazotropha sp. (ex Semelilucina semeliformis)]|nr:flagellar protein FliT [Candidatus Thiodiazotropha sp. (ex Semelilucina semeliformis)]